MAAIVPMVGRASGLIRRRKWLSLALTVPALVVLASWWFTAPLDDEPRPGRRPRVVPAHLPHPRSDDAGGRGPAC